MAPASACSPSAKPKLLPHQLVARDSRSSYIQRVHTLAGPGAYVIPSTFQQSSLNDKLRDVQRQQYGREFARKQRQQCTGADGDTRLAEQDVAKNDPNESKQRRNAAALDKYRARRDQLRAMLQQMHHQQQESWRNEMSSPISGNRAMALVADAPPPSMSPNPSCYDAYVDGYRRAQGSTAATCAQVAPLDLRLAPSSPSTASSYSELEEIGLSIEEEDFTGAAAAVTSNSSSLAVGQQVLHQASWRVRSRSDDANGSATNLICCSFASVSFAARAARATATSAAAATTATATRGIDVDTNDVAAVVPAVPLHHQLRAALEEEEQQQQQLLPVANRLYAAQLQRARRGNGRQAGVRQHCIPFSMLLRTGTRSSFPSDTMSSIG